MCFSIPTPHQVRTSLKKLRLFLRWLGFSLGAAILIYQIVTGGSSFILYSITPSWFMLALALIMTITAFGIQMWAWQVIMISLDVKLTYPQVLSGYLPSFLPRYIPGTIWGFISRSEWLSQKFGVSYSVSSFGSVLEIIASLLANIIVIGVCFATTTLEAIQLLVAGFILSFAVYGFIRLLYNLSHRVPRLAKIVPISLPRISILSWIVSITLLICTWVLYGAALSFVLHALAGNSLAGAFSWANTTGIYSAAWLFGFLVLIAPAGMGFRELAIAHLLAQFQILDSQLAAMIGVVMRLIVMSSELLWVVGVLLMGRYLKHRATG